MDQLINLSDFRSAVTDPRHRPDPVALAALANELNGFIRQAREAGIGEEFIERATRAVLDGYQRLDALPRNNPFWEGSNRRPTWYKLPALCTMLLEVDPGDGRAVSTLAATHIVSFLGFNAALWLPLVRHLGLDPSWPIHASLYLNAYCGPDSVPSLVFLLDVAAIREAAVPIFGEFARSGHRFASAWALRVLDALGPR